ncbi:MAG TPA: HDOD domain-containing protein [Gemmatirosa sp.]
MLAFLRRWFRRDTAPAAPASAPVASAPSPVVASLATAAPRAPVAAVIVDSDVEDAPTTALDARVVALHDAPPPPNADAAYRAGLRALTAAVVGAPADTVRQLPSAAREALAVCDDPRAGAAELARVCEGDLAVARALLREANSIFYARPGQAPAASLREAIDRVGTAGVRNVLVDVTVSALLCTPGSRYAAVTAAIWAHAQRTAALARAAAGAFALPPERAYAAGLLHDVGKLVLLDRAAAIVEERSAPTVAWPALRAARVALHEPLGALAVLRWGMGAEAARAIASHHRAPPPEARDATSEVICLAECVDHAATRGDPLDLDALWTERDLKGSRPRAAAALARHLGPITPFALDDASDPDYQPTRLSRLVGR